MWHRTLQIFRYRAVERCAAKVSRASRAIEPMGPTIAPMAPLTPRPADCRSAASTAFAVGVRTRPLGNRANLLGLREPAADSSARRSALSLF